MAEEIENNCTSEKPDEVVTKSSHNERRNLLVCDLLESNTAIFDEEEDYLKQIASHSTECPNNLNNELITSYDKCESLFHLALYQQILHNEGRVRLRPGNDIYSNKTKIERINLSLNMKKFLFSISESAYQLLKKENLLGDFVELDSENEGIVTLKGNQRTINIHTDVLSLVNKSSIYNYIKKEAMSKKKNTEVILSERTKKYRFPRRGEKVNINARTFGITKLGTDYDITESEDSDQSDGDDSINITLTFVLTVRNSLPAAKVLEQCISNIFSPKTKKFIIACHIGPMVEEQHIAIYKHRCSRRNKGVFETRNIDKIMAIWNRTKAKTTFVMTGPKESLKYSIFNSTNDKNYDDYDKDDVDDIDEDEDDNEEDDYDGVEYDNDDNDDDTDKTCNPDELCTFNTKSQCYSSKIL